MLLYFKVRNYRSIREEATLDMEATGLHDSTNILLPHGASQYLPAVAIFGKNGGGKSNILRAMWLAVQFICNAQRTQTEHAPIPVHPFLLDDHSYAEPTSFEFGYVIKGIKYVYGFSATREHVESEYLKTWPTKREKNVFDRRGQSFNFPKNNDRKRKEMIAEAVRENQLFFAVSCTMNYGPCIEAMRWFRESVVFSRDYNDIDRNILEYSQDEDMLKSIGIAAMNADVGIHSIRFEFENQELDLNNEANLPKDLKGVVKALKAFQEALRQENNESEIRLGTGAIKSITYHSGVNKKGEMGEYALELQDESDGTRRLMALAPAIEKTLRNGGLLIVDELEQGMHIMLVEYVLRRYQISKSNPYSAQILFTTHETALLDQDVLRRDQVYFVDKDNNTGASSLYSLADFRVRNDMDIQKAYLLGKFGAIPFVEEG